MAHKVLVIAPDARLEKSSGAVVPHTSDLAALAGRMRHIMHRYDGIGLAAPQIGIQKKLAVLELHDAREKEQFAFTVLIDPKIVSRSPERQTKEEGCLSLPGVAVDVERAKKIRLRTTTLAGKRITLTAEGLFARAIQHEIDHLQGVLITKRARVQHPLNRPPRILFFGSSLFSLPVLEELLHFGYPIVGLVTEPPGRSGRGQRVTQNQFQQVAQKLALPVFAPDKLTDQAFLDQIRAVEPDLGVVASYGRLIPPELFNLPSFKTLNVHPSILPKYRGAAPIQQALLDGEKITGVTIIQLSKKMDAGPIISRVRVPISVRDTGITLLETLSRVGARLLHATIGPYVAGKRPPKQQPKEGVTYTKKIKKTDGLLDFSQPADVIIRKIRAYQPWPGAYTMIGAKTLKIFEAHSQDGLLVFDIVQLEGKRAMSFTDFARGWRGKLDFPGQNRLHSSMRKLVNT